MSTAKIIKLFQDRNSMFNTTTQEILTQLHIILDGIHAFLVDTNPSEMTNGKLTWIAFDVNIDDEMLLLSGEVNYEVGATITSNAGEVIVVTADTQQYVKRPVQVAVPISLASGSVEEVVQFFITLNRQRASDESKSNLIGLDPDFNLDGLSDVQKQALNLYMLSQGASGEQTS